LINCSSNISRFVPANPRLPKLRLEEDVKDNIKDAYALMLKDTQASHPGSKTKDIALETI